MDKLTSPKDIALRKKLSETMSLRTEIERKFWAENYEIFDDYVEMILTGETSKEARDIMVEEYKKASWRDVVHQTSSENGERPGLTSFKFYF